MIIQTTITNNEGTEFKKTFSDKNLKIQCGNDIYNEAIDPIDSTKEYFETDLLIQEPSEEEKEEKTEDNL